MNVYTPYEHIYPCFLVGVKQSECTHHMTKPVITATHVTQQVSGLLTSSSSSFRQQHRQVRYTESTSRLKPRPTADTQTRRIRDCQTESGKHGADGQIKQEVDRFICCQCCNSIKSLITFSQSAFFVFLSTRSSGEKNT